MLRLHGITPVMVSPLWEDDRLDEAQLAKWVKQAMNLPGWGAKP